MGSLVNNKDLITYDRIQRKEIRMPVDMAVFLDDIISVCARHRLSISQEDGLFVIEPYGERNIERLVSAMKNY